MGAVTVFRDVTQERRQQHELSYQASHDVLTGLVNRRAFNEQLQRAVDGARRGTGEHVLLYIDLDQFKAVNDSCGHPAGDQLLVDVTALLQARVRSVDTVARLGGDEFAILLKGCPLERARKIAESIRLAVKDYQFVWKEASLGIGASIGLATVTQATESMASLLSATDIACYAAKQAGRNRVHIYVQPD
jgi:diguanylate cyclase (GGDEF)-like protein